MKYGEFKDFVLQLINQFSANGDELTASYNDQSDYMMRIPHLLNAAMLEIAANAQPMVSVMPPTAEEQEDLGNGWTRVTVPEDFMRMTEDGIPVIRDGIQTRLKAYYMVGDGKVDIRNDLMRHGILEYCRNPKRVDTIAWSGIDGVELDGSIEAQTAAAYYVASMLVMQDDAFAYAALRNEYDDKLSSMKKRLRAEVYQVADVMGASYPYM